MNRLSFSLPPELEASEPPEARGLTRDAVRMMVVHRSDGEPAHSTFALLPSFLEAGDLIVINTSGTIAGAVDALSPDGEPVVLHFSTQLDADTWVVEPRRRAGRNTERWSGSAPPGHLAMGEGASIELVGPYLGGRLWVGRPSFPQAPLTWLAVHGRPIRYAYVERPWPLTAYQNVYATEPGSAEMPSAGRPFTAEVISRLVAKGVGVSPVVLHTGVASLGSDELPYPERVRMPATTAGRINATRLAGGRVIAIGTTAVRAVEAASDPSGRVSPLDAWTDVVITPERGVRAVDGILTGWHEPEA
ncbi:MAG TPA: S-adenosylmethionine:tRNA ribosyltransferase-isomerase, partial [Acidimicrobiales bacterium]|nr:S-adenosylmethionine:tRNA ribosyltransferase-isomerase [Acidimicrobiales bacterium]